MKRTNLLLWVLSGCICYLHAQVPVPNGSFENWERQDLLISFPPYQSITNQAAVAEGLPQHAYPIPTPNGGHGIRLETQFVDADVLVAAMGIGEFSPHKAGAAYQGMPDSLIVRLRYAIEDMDNALIAINLFANGALISGPSIFAFTGVDSVWHTETFNIPTLPQAADSIGVLIVAGDFNQAQLGTWMEIDSMAFTGPGDPFPNGQFSLTDSISALIPDPWLTGNELAALVGTTPFVRQSTDAYEGTYAARIETGEFTTETDTDTAGFLFFAQTISGIGPEGGYPVPDGANNPLALTGYYQYHPSGLDTAIAYIVMTRFDQALQVRDTVEIQAHLLPPSPEYQFFQIPLSPDSPADSFLLAFASSDIGGGFTSAEPGLGSYLLLDALTFDTTQTTGIKDSFSSHGWHIYPNPAQTYIEIAHPSGTQYPMQISLMDLHGKMVLPAVTVPAHTTKHRLNLQPLSPGCYLIQGLIPHTGHRFYQKCIKR